MGLTGIKGEAHGRIITVAVELEPIF